MTYDEFRTGLSYSAVWRMLWVADPDSSKWVHKSPGVVLSFWRGIKQQMWEEFYARGIDPELLPPPRPLYRVKHARALLTVRQTARLLDMTDDQVFWAIGHGKMPGAFRGRRLWRSWLIPRCNLGPSAPA